MKKTIMIGIIGVLSLCTISSVNALASSLINLYGNKATALILENADWDLHTSIWPTYINEPVINVINTVQRKNFWGNWENQAQLTFNVNQAEKAYQMYFQFQESKKDTRSIWYNDTSGSTLRGYFFIDNGDYT